MPLVLSSGAMSLPLYVALVHASSGQLQTLSVVSGSPSVVEGHPDMSYGPVRKPK